MTALMSSSGNGIGAIVVPGRPFLTIGIHELAGLVVEHELRAEEVGAAELTAAGVGAVAGAAGPAKMPTAALDHLGVALRTLLRREPASSLTGPGRSAGQDAARGPAVAGCPGAAVRHPLR